LKKLCDALDKKNGRRGKMNTTFILGAAEPRMADLRRPPKEHFSIVKCIEAFSQFQNPYYQHQ
jgi:hypothetical protein